MTQTPWKIELSISSIMILCACLCMLSYTIVSLLSPIVFLLLHCILLSITASALAYLYCIISAHPSPILRIESPSLSAARLCRLNVPKKPKYISLYIKTTWPGRHYRDQPTTTHAPPSTILLSTFFLSPSVSGVRSLFSSIAAHLERRLSASSRTVGV